MYCHESLILFPPGEFLSLLVFSSCSLSFFLLEGFLFFFFVFFGKNFDCLPNNEFFVSFCEAFQQAFEQGGIILLQLLILKMTDAHLRCFHNLPPNFKILMVFDRSFSLLNMKSKGTV